jgi:hypothetical protein
MYKIVRLSSQHLLVYTKQPRTLLLILLTPPLAILCLLTLQHTITSLTPSNPHPAPTTLPTLPPCPPQPANSKCQAISWAWLESEREGAKLDRLRAVMKEVGDRQRLGGGEVVFLEGVRDLEGVGSWL